MSVLYWLLKPATSNQDTVLSIDNQKKLPILLQKQQSMMTFVSLLGIFIDSNANIPVSQEIVRATEIKSPNKIILFDINLALPRQPN